MKTKGQVTTGHAYLKIIYSHPLLLLHLYHVYIASVDRKNISRLARYAVVLDQKKKGLK